jgi:hypothetical protein
MGRVLYASHELLDLWETPSTSSLRHAVILSVVDDKLSDFVRAQHYHALALYTIHDFDKSNILF